MNGVGMLKTNRPSGRRTRATWGTVTVRIGEPHRPVIAEDEVEARVGERQLFRVAPHEREPRPRRVHVRPRGRELVRAEVEADHRGAAHRDAQAELRRATAELERVEPVEGGQGVDVVFWMSQVPQPRPIPSREEVAVAALVVGAVGLPAGEVGPHVVAGHRSSQPPAAWCASATMPAAIDSAMPSASFRPRSSPTGDVHPLQLLVRHAHRAHRIEVAGDVASRAHHADEPGGRADRLGEQLAGVGRVVVGQHDGVALGRARRPRARPPPARRRPRRVRVAARRPPRDSPAAPAGAGRHARRRSRTPRTPAAGRDAARRTPRRHHRGDAARAVVASPRSSRGRRRLDRLRVELRTAERARVGPAGHDRSSACRPGTAVTPRRPCTAVTSTRSSTAAHRCRGMSGRDGHPSRPPSSSIACGSTGSTASSDSRTPFGDCPAG